ncbi:MAG TPA: lactonase family protein [Tepidisphaeraceae bacterium]|jgi:6-phosphogluconolactonase
MWMYVGTTTRRTSRGIYGLELDETTGQFSEPKLMAETNNPSFLALSSNGERLYAVAEPGTFDGQPHAGITAYAVDKASRALTVINAQPTGETGNCHVGVTPDGKYVGAADYGSAVVTLVPVRADGGLDPATTNIKHNGRGPNPERQEKAHAHCATSDPTGQYFIVCDLGMDETVVYRITNGKTLERHSHATAAPGAGPRHVDFGRDRRFAYVVNELDNTVDVMRWDAKAGTLVREQTVPMLPPDFKAYSKAAEVCVHPSGQFVYASNRGHDSIAKYHVDRDTGHLSVAGQTPCGGKSPRHFGVEPTGKFLISCHEESDTLVAFRINDQTGDLTPTGGVAKVNRPMCVVFTA